MGRKSELRAVIEILFWLLAVLALLWASICWDAYRLTRRIYGKSRILSRYPFWILALLVLLLALTTITGRAAYGSPGDYPFISAPMTPEDIYPLPEVLLDPENTRCIIYRNLLQPAHGTSMEYVDLPIGTVILKIFPQKGYAPDTLEVWDLPPGVIAEPMSLTLEEHQRDKICFRFVEIS